ncbi:DUF4383 domain-containing protein [Sinomonas atrocyanea]|jgi:ABC-type transport system involved in multi-copper enzyme maturation permease subunit|uniref:DUF4383 domain-containing protein n=1 Tax=Sinomonas atrocyanea TaxID=37927 RepID=UPI00277DFEFE|nr:DUF4383 domain-containing protein [Sinomonas atrocyanea]MDQ0261596.1 ABC-type transport system involved in multi-copper enzyme maturation permease subunit [Sinomonas atrocyanea]MDR6621545.1 ABC-type transport system involved in multi-copper enzyme maturation permease subunit [Sinomonas atrocyanea]
MSTSVVSNRRTAVQVAATVVGAVFLLVGVLGFIPGITSGSGLAFAGHHSEAYLLGLFQVSVLHNVVHLLFGIAGLALGRSAGGSKGFLVWGGAIYLVLFVYGLVFGGESAGNFVPLNAADNGLHLLLGVGMLVIGLILGRTLAPSRQASAVRR